MDSILSLIAGPADWVFSYGVPFVLVLSLLVFVHEWGHYYVARLCGVKVTNFSIGFGKEIWGINDKHGTRWKISMIPLGGYVQMYGDTDPASAGKSEASHKKEDLSTGGTPVKMSEEDRKVAFFAQPLWQRAAIVFAGPAINFIFAIILLFGLYVSIGKPVTPPIAGAVVVDGAAYDAGIQPGDRIVDINGQAVRSFEHLQRAVLVALDTGMDITVDRAGQEIVFEKVTPKRITEEDKFGFQQSRGQLGIIGPDFKVDVASIMAVNETLITDNRREVLLDYLDTPISLTLPGPEEDLKVLVQPMREDNDAFLNFDPSLDTRDVLALSSQGNGGALLELPVGAALVESVRETKNIVTSTMEALWQIISGVRSAKELGGIIRIGAIAGDAAQAGIIALITFTALLSINLGLINLFPIPMLDGGHLLFYAIEAIKGKPIPEQAQEYAFRFGLAILVALMLFANLNDIVQLVL